VIGRRKIGVDSSYYFVALLLSIEKLTTIVVWTSCKSRLDASADFEFLNLDVNMVDRRRERVVHVEAGGIAGRIDGAKSRERNGFAKGRRGNPQPVTSNPIIPVREHKRVMAYLV
jgi:hypothetical protein